MSGYNSLITVSDKVNFFKANKSGLAFAVLDYYSSAAYDYQHWYGYGMIDCSNSKNLFDDVIVLGLYFLDSDNNDLSSVIIGQSSAIGNKAGGSSTYYVKVSIPKEKVRAMTSFL